MKKLFYLATVTIITISLTGCDIQNQTAQNYQNQPQAQNQVLQAPPNMPPSTAPTATRATNGVYNFGVNNQSAAQPVAQPQAATQSIIFNKTLALGSSGTAVDNLQQFLKDEGLYAGQDSGYFDQATQDAVIAFEQQENITPANGIFSFTEQSYANNIAASHPDWLTNLSNNTQYNNVNGSPVHSPSDSSNGVPAGASAVCRDGTYSFSMHRSGTCSHHGGVAQWLN
jgi:hypothetical protein